MARVLLTGASGFVGGASVIALTEAGHEVTATSTTGDPGPLNASHPNADQATWIAWDSNQTLLPELDIAGFDSVVHLAAPRQRKAFPDTVGPVFRTNVAATLELAKIVQRAGRHLLFASTGDVFAAGPARVAESVREFTPRDFYGSSKAAAEIMLASFRDTTAITVLRIFHPYGPGGESFLVNRLMDRVAEGGEIVIEGEDGISLNPVWIDDLAVGIASAVQLRASGTFHLAGRETVTLRELVSQMAVLWHREPNLVSSEAKPPGGHDGDFSEAVAHLGYAPAVNLDEGLRRLAAAREGA